MNRNTAKNHAEHVSLAERKKRLRYAIIAFLISTVGNAILYLCLGETLWDAIFHNIFIMLTFPGMLVLLIISYRNYKQAQDEHREHHQDPDENAIARAEAEARIGKTFDSVEELMEDLKAEEKRAQ